MVPCVWLVCECMPLTRASHHVYIQYTRILTYRKTHIYIHREAPAATEPEAAAPTEEATPPVAPVAPESEEHASESESESESPAEPETPAA